MKSSIILAAIACVLLVGCDSNNSLGPFQPQINNVANTFQLQATGVNNVSTTLNYTWQNDGTTGNVNQASTVGASAPPTSKHPSTISDDAIVSFSAPCARNCCALPLL